jgi:hypothetical protein
LCNYFKKCNLIPPTKSDLIEKPAVGEFNTFEFPAKNTASMALLYNNLGAFWRSRRESSKHGSCAIAVEASARQGSRERYDKSLERRCPERLDFRPIERSRSFPGTIDSYGGTEHEISRYSNYYPVDYYEDYQDNFASSPLPGNVGSHEDTEHGTLPTLDPDSVANQEDSQHDIPPSSSFDTVECEDIEHYTTPCSTPNTDDNNEDTECDDIVGERAVLTEEQELIIADAKAAFRSCPRLPWFILDGSQGKRSAKWRRSAARQLMPLVEPMDDDRRTAFYQMLVTCESGNHWTQILGALFHQYPQAMVHDDDSADGTNKREQPSDEKVARSQHSTFGDWTWAAANAKVPSPVADEIGPMGEVEPGHNVKCPCENCRVARCKLGPLSRSAIKFKDATQVKSRMVKGKMAGILRSHSA